MLTPGGPVISRTEGFTGGISYYLRYLVGVRLPEYTGYSGNYWAQVQLPLLSAWPVKRPKSSFAFDNKIPVIGEEKVAESME